MADLQKSTKAAKIIAQGLFGYAGEPLEQFWSKLSPEEKFRAFHVAHRIEKVYSELLDDSSEIQHSRGTH